MGLDLGRELVVLPPGREAGYARIRGRARCLVSSPEVPAGRHQLRFEFEPTGKPDIAQGKGTPGRAQLYVNGQLVAQADFPVTTPIAFNPGALVCGANPGSPITPDYQPPFRFTGTLHTATIDLSGDLITDTESEMRVAMARSNIGARDALTLLNTRQASGRSARGPARRLLAGRATAPHPDSFS